MGNQTTLVILNDALHDIRNDPEFGNRLYNATLGQNGGRFNTIPAGTYANAAEIIETHHAGSDVLILAGGNTANVVAVTWDNPTYLTLNGIEYKLTPMKRKRKIKP